MTRIGRGQRPELLAPAGSMESLMAAVQNGADAVYLGGKAFGARASAANFGREEMQEALRYAHLYGVKVYVTVNTLYKDDELEPLKFFLEELYADGVDGVILQDLGAAQLIRQAFPDLEVHASTQMTVHNLAGAQYLAELGFKRVVLARELGLEEIREIIEQAPIEVETFIHGALCISYSGQCLMSSLIGGRSGNRGRCAQPCRLPYQLVDRETGDISAAVPEPKYLLSPKDINTLEILPELIQAGICSFKIEGRLKRPEYTASVIRVYRKYMDLAQNDPRNYKVEPEDLLEVTQIFNRGGFSSGYYLGKSGKSMMSFERPKNWGVPIGKVISYDDEQNLCRVQLTGMLEEGDGVEIWTGEEENPGTTVHSVQKQGGFVIFPIKGAIRPGNPVYRTAQKELLTELAQSYATFQRMIPLAGQIRLQPGEPLRLHLWDEDGSYVKVESAEPVEQALKAPLTREKIAEQVGKLGNLPFELRELGIEMAEDVFVPVSKLNALRREAVLQLIEARVRHFGGPRTAKPVKPALLVVPTAVTTAGGTRRKEKVQQGCGPELAVYLNGNHFNPENFIRAGVRRLYLNLHQVSPEKVRKLKQLGGEETAIYAVLPRIARTAHLHRVEESVEGLRNTPLEGVLVGNLGEAEVVRRLGISFIADFSLNIFNRLTLNYWAERGAEAAVLSPELNLRELAELVNWVAMEKEVIVYGYLPVMVSEYCPVGAVEGGMAEGQACSRPGTKNQYGLLDRMGLTFPVLTDCANCRSVILNTQPLFVLEQLEQIRQTGFSTLRMDLTIETEEAALQIVRAYQTRLREPEIGLSEEMRELIKQMQRQGFTKGHFYRGVE